MTQLQEASTNESTLIAKEPCPKCGSRDNLARYSDGHGFCFGAGCGYYESASGTGAHSNDDLSRGERKDLLDGTVSHLSSRNLSEDTCRRFQYLCGEDKHGTPVQIAQYRDRDGRIVAQKLRYGDKRGFPWVGTPKSCRLFGSNLFGQGKKLVVTEGEIDCMSVSQAQNHKWPVVSVINGASGAKKDLLNNADYLEKFEEVILMFDNDEPGQLAAQECAKALSGYPFKVKIASLPLKDANELLKAGRTADIISGIWNAVEWKPEGLVEASLLLEEFLAEDQYSRASYPFESLQVFLHGLRTSELVTVTAGTGTGKSAFVREIVYGLHRSGESVGVLMLEESVKRTLEGLVGIHINQPVHTGRASIDREVLRKGFIELFSKPLYLLDHFGSTGVEDLLTKIRYMAKTLGCRWIILDHVSIVVSGMETNDERRAIDETMTKLRTLVQEAKIGLIIVSHLRRNTGDSDSHERGGEVSLSHLRGSHSIAQLSDVVIALERDQQSENNRDVTTVRVIKNRYTGETGIVCHLKWHKDTGRLLEFAKEFKSDVKPTKRSNPVGQDETSKSAF